MCIRPGDLITSDEGVEVREKVRAEILDVLEKSSAEVKSVIAFQGGD